MSRLDPIDGLPVPKDVPDPRELAGDKCNCCGYEYRVGDWRSGLFGECADCDHGCVAWRASFEPHRKPDDCHWIGMADAVPMAGQRVIMRLICHGDFANLSMQTAKPHHMDWGGAYLEWVPIEEVPTWMR